LATPAFGRCLLAFGLLLCGKALEQCFQPCQQALFIAIAERYLHLATCQGDMDISTRWSLWQCRDCLTHGLSLGLLGGWLTGAIAGMVNLVEPLLGQCKSTLLNPCGYPMFAPV